MKTILLMRHAEAAPSEGADFERPLTAQGHRMARDVAVRLTTRGMWPDIIHCSAALRTRQTCQNLLDIWQPDTTPHVMYDPSIYRADANDLVRLIQEQDDEFSSIMLIGHNPTIHMATLFLCAPQGNDMKQHVAKAFPPSSCAIFSFDVGDWRDVNKGRGQLIDYFYSGDL